MENCFWFGYQFDHLLFPFIKISSCAGFSYACICLFLLALVYEMLSIGAIKARLKSILSKKLLSQSEGDRSWLIARLSTQGSMSLLFAETGIYLIELVFGYTVMMIVMTFNGYFFIIAVTVSTATYFFMGQTIMNVNLEISSIKKSQRGNSSTTISSTDVPITVLEPAASSCCSQDPNVVMYT